MTYLKCTYVLRRQYARRMFLKNFRGGKRELVVGVKLAAHFQKMFKNVLWSNKSRKPYKNVQQVRIHFFGRFFEVAVEISNAFGKTFAIFKQTSNKS